MPRFTVHRSRSGAMPSPTSRAFGMRHQHLVRERGVCCSHFPRGTSLNKLGPSRSDPLLL